jgi:hypothetical protein
MKHLVDGFPYQVLAKLVDSALIPTLKAVVGSNLEIDAQRGIPVIVVCTMEKGRVLLCIGIVTFYV